ncbi:UDP-N-acetylmuramate--L-alanine ligase [Schaalia cardiffensis]|uniref:UDP-N-acetylmuramate--L-alanine ligase n=1 Tax=Schaalia cardiffensis TaxID=181487 RepID=UPI0018E7BB81|nr:UDP-N-acetylmuramate--L-alanine ligase [Schaalia cardiffensis]MBJ2328973.1 UDP-N-acetylmuramate--L-alanine ligase [Schaalia cardiffensis]
MTTTVLRPIEGSFHLIGIGGAGMSVVAELLKERGATVSGSDRSDSDALTRLKSRGISCFVGHDAANVPEDATIVVSTAIRETNPELVIGRKRGQRIIHRSRALALAASGMRFLAVAGAHGKTTTSGMLAVALRAAGLDPSVAVGGIVPQFGSGAHLGTGDVFVAEADESDASFLNYRPNIEIVTNVEPDHLDRYGTPEAFEEVFLDFARQLDVGGVLIVCAEDPGAARLASAALELGIRVLTYGRPETSLIPADIEISELELSARSGSAIFASSAGIVRVAVNVPGVHNILNAAAAWAAGVLLGIEPQVMASSLEAFTGTARRFEARGEVDGRRVFDDYAHHPTEVAASIAEARIVVGDAPVVVVFQPHLFSRTRIFAERFAQALSGADRVVVTEIYAAREDPEPGVTAELISSKIEGALYVPDMHEAARLAARECGEKGIVLTMGAGSITDCADDVLEEWSIMAGQE